MNKQARKILIRGGKVTKEEQKFLHKHLPYESVEDTTSFYLLGYTQFYLKEAFGYCLIYDRVCYNLDIGESEEIINEFYNSHEPRIMNFYDLTLQHKFSSYEDLLEYSFNVNYDRRLLDPRNDPEFFEIFDRGFMLSEDDYDIFGKYIKYVDCSDYHENSTAVIPLGNTEECRIKIGYFFDCNKPFKHIFREPLYEGDFSYSVGGTIIKDFTT